MKVYNQEKTQELTNYDLTKGRLQYDNGVQIFIPYTKEEKAEKEYFNLKQWFDNDYMRQEQKLRRLHTLGKDYQGKSAYDALIDLYNQAEEVRAKINELEAIIDS